MMRSTKGACIDSQKGRWSEANRAAISGAAADEATPSTGRSLSLVVVTKFYPSIGGIETLADLLARQWIESGHRVTIITDVPLSENAAREFPFPIVRNPVRKHLLRLVSDADVVVHHHISLKTLWPLIIVRRPFVAVHHSTYFPLSGPQPWREKLKVWVAKHLAFSISVSDGVKQRIGCGGVVIPNLYDDERFTDLGLPRTKDLVFVGRLVSDKGVNVLLDALGELKRAGHWPSLTVVGDGPERTNLLNQIQQLDLSDQVTLVGWKSREEIARILNEHRIMVVPSVWDEPFGIVALEGAACGCVVVGSNGGGLPEAIGPCGLTFPNGDHSQLAAILADLLLHPDRLPPFSAAAPAHLVQHRADVVGDRYLRYFQEVLSAER